jgi:hypothetical protein
MKRTIQKGQSLVTLLFFVVIAVSITSASILIIFSNGRAVAKDTEGKRAYYVAQSGLENALLRFIRDPLYTGETLTVGSDGTATITVTGIGPYIITSKGTSGNFIRTLQATVTYTNNIATVSAWQEL